jgi:hypothetical protein
MNNKKACIKINYFNAYFLLLSLLITIPLPAYANAGVPMIFISYPVMLLMLVPIIGIESFAFYKIYNVSYKRSLLSNSVSNAVSTLAGYPLAWGFLFGIEIITTGGGCGPGFDTVPDSIITVIVESAWICPRESYLYWLVPAAFIISLFVAFVFSLIIEYYINRLFYKSHDRILLRKAVLLSNIFSYALLLVISIIYLTYSIIDKQHI